MSKLPPAPPPERQLTLCADDFGLNAGVSGGIAQLVRSGRLCAVSCITNNPHWLATVSLLDKHQDKVSLGLHINLTEGRPLSRALARVWPRLPSLPGLILQAHSGFLPREALRSELQAQLEAFRVGTGSVPCHVDGHQHIHHLPVIRALVLELIGGVVPVPAVRNTAFLPGVDFALKRWMIRATGGAALLPELVARELDHNSVLLGVYDFGAGDYGARMRHWLGLLPATGGLLFCHPGLGGAQEPADPIGSARMRELDYLASDMFLHDLEAAGVSLARRGGPQENVHRLLIPKVSSKASPVATT